MLAWHRVAWVMALVVAVTAVQGLDHHHHIHPLSRLNMMVDHVESSIWDKKQRLGEGHSFAPDEHEDGVTIVEEQETHPEDTEDYVNNAPWTRRTNPSPSVNIIDMQMIKLAAQNAQRVKIEGKCEVPQQRCEAIRSTKHSPDTVFLPRCALLHRCSEDTGCCISDDNICGPAETETVELFFYAFGDTRAKIEVMTFVNHTRCSCQPRSNNIVPTCKCPRYYSPVTDNHSRQCACDCDIGRSKCRRYKKGRRYFSAADISCISSGECVEPTCEYGPFLTRQRRCTKRRERERYVTSRK